MDSLPNDLLSEILRRASNHRSRSYGPETLAAVSHQWAELLLTARTVRLCQSIISIHSLRSILTSLPGVAALKLEPSGGGPSHFDSPKSVFQFPVETANTALGVLASTCGSSLTSLDLSGAYKGGFRGLANIALGCPLLQKLSLNNCFSIGGVYATLGVVAVALNCPQLRVLEVGGLWDEKTEKEGSKVLKVAAEGAENLTAGSSVVFWLLWNESKAPHEPQHPQSNDVSRYLNKLNESDLSQVVTSVTEVRNDWRSAFTVFTQTLSYIAKLASASESNPTLLDTALLGLTSTSQHLHSLSLARNKHLTDTGLTSVSKLVNLTRLNLAFTSGWSEQGLAPVMSKCSSLTDVEYCGGALTDAALGCLQSRGGGLRHLKLCRTGGDVTPLGLQSLGGVTGLVELEIRECASLDDLALAGILGGCRALKQLELCNCDAVTGSAFAALSLPALSHLKLRSSQLSPSGLASIAAACPELREVMIDSCRFGLPAHQRVEPLPGVAIGDFAICKNLKQLEVWGPVVTGLAFANRLESPQFPQLESLKVSHLRADGHFHLLALNCPALRSLTFTSPDFSDDHVSSLLQCTGLESLTVDLTDTCKLTGTGFNQASFAALQSLSVSSDRLTDEGVSHIVLSCPALRSLKLVTRVREWGSRNMPIAEVTDVGLGALSQLPKLEALELHGFRGVSGAGFSHGFRNLRELVIRDGGLDDEGLHSLVSGAKQLESLVVQLCRRLSAERLAAFEREHCLKRLELTFCWHEAGSRTSNKRTGSLARKTDSDPLREPGGSTGSWLDRLQSFALFGSLSWIGRR